MPVDSQSAHAHAWPRSKRPGGNKQGEGAREKTVGDVTGAKCLARTKTAWTICTDKIKELPG